MRMIVLLYATACSSPGYVRGNISGSLQQDVQSGFFITDPDGRHVLVFGTHEDSCSTETAALERLLELAPVQDGEPALPDVRQVYAERVGQGSVGLTSVFMTEAVELGPTHAFDVPETLASHTTLDPPYFLPDDGQAPFSWQISGSQTWATSGSGTVQFTEEEALGTLRLGFDEQEETQGFFVEFRVSSCPSYLDAQRL